MADERNGRAGELGEKVVHTCLLSKILLVLHVQTSSGDPVGQCELENVGIAYSENWRIKKASEADIFHFRCSLKSA